MEFAPLIWVAGQRPSNPLGENSFGPLHGGEKWRFVGRGNQSKTMHCVGILQQKNFKKFVLDPVNIHRKAHKTAWISRVAAQEQAQQ
ncbi:MAG: hypothetical protein HQM00_07555 [Magnetococcales bacterium]|nr:hypothetical protein [Magnetococcales bacterium]